MSGNLLSSFEFNHIQALHDLVMMKVSEGLAVDFEVGYLAPLVDDNVVGLILGDGHVAPHEVADGIELLGALGLDLLKLLLGLFDPLLDRIRLRLLLLALVRALRLFHLLRHRLRDHTQIFPEVVHIIPHY